ncbi:recombination-associated protein RdgC [Neptunomonas antarctica]|uniref:Recombination-associated protein RdgC n=1 Tax=Neptunomonas antarctica TaxID=619304 RepID=A0A1N7KL11_9GAMM|nr:recombination-associated protein RdgC [Neptunomonas antarctica]SIS62196.1 recombination associated protein RdgC [Neptunomonas antarctica]
MWFKNFIFYRFTEQQDYTQEQLETAFSEHLFEPCRSQELSRFGWVAPHPALDEQTVFASSGAYLITAQKEEKILPATVIKKNLNERVHQIEQEQARKVYRKEQLQMKDEIILDLLPRAFSKFQQTSALLLPRAGFIVVDSSSHKGAEELLNLLRNSLSTLPIALPETQQSPGVVMSEWLQQTSSFPAFTCLDECELKDQTEEGGVIRIKGHDLHSSEVIAHLEKDKKVTKLAMQWDETLSFILQDDLSIKRVKPTDELTQTLNEEASEDPLVRLDSDVARLALECQRLYPQLLEAFGGQIQR